MGILILLNSCNIIERLLYLLSTTYEVVSDYFLLTKWNENIQIKKTHYACYLSKCKKTY